MEWFAADFATMYMPSQHLIIQSLAASRSVATDLTLTEPPPIMQQEQESTSGSTPVASDSQPHPQSQQQSQDHGQGVFRSIYRMKVMSLLLTRAAATAVGLGYTGFAVTRRGKTGAFTVTGVGAKTSTASATIHSQLTDLG